MLFLQLLINGLITGCGIGLVAVSFGLVYSSSRVFHVAHAGVYTMGGYVAWSMLRHGFPAPVAFLVAGVILLQWSRADARQARAFDRKSERDPEHDELAAYNRYLADLAKRG